MKYEQGDNERERERERERGTRYVHNCQANDYTSLEQCSSTKVKVDMQ